MNGREMDIGRGGIHVVMAHKRLEDGEVYAGFGQGRAEGMAERVRMTSLHTGPNAVIAKYRT